MATSKQIDNPTVTKPVSTEAIDSFLADAVILAKKYSITIDTVIEAKKTLEIERTNNIASKARE